MSGASNQRPSLMGGPLPALIATAALVGIIAAAGLVFAGRVSLEHAKLWSLVATVVWFVAAPVWLLRHQAEEEH